MHEIVIGTLYKRGKCRNKEGICPKRLHDLWPDMFETKRTHTLFGARRMRCSYNKRHCHKILSNSGRNKGGGTMALDQALTISERYHENFVSLTLVRLFGLFTMIASGLLVNDIALKLYRRRGPFLQKVSLTQSILIVLSIGDFFG